MSTPKFHTHYWGAPEWAPWAQYRTGMKGWNWLDKIPQPETSPGEAMTPTTSDRFFALAARVESALPDAGYTVEDAAELVGALMAYWEGLPTEQAYEALKAVQERVLFAAARAGKVNRDHPALPAHYALDRAAQAFVTNEPEPFTGRDSTYYLNECERHLGVKP